MDYIATFIDGHKTSTLAHYGIKDQKWGVRRFQNPDGTLTEEGRRRYGVGAAASRAYEKSARYKAKSDSYALKSRRAHDKYDQFKADKLERKSEKYAAKSSSQYAKAVKLSNKDDKIVNRRYSESDIYALEGAKRAGLLGAAVGKAVGVYKERKERKQDADRLAKESALADLDLIEREDSEETHNWKNPRDTVKQLSKLGYSVGEIAADLPFDLAKPGEEEEYVRKILGRHKTGSKESSYKTGSKSWVEEAANDPEHWELIDDTPGERLYKRRDSSKSSESKEKSKISVDSMNAVTDALITGNAESAYRKLHNDGYRPSEIAKMLGQSTKDDGKPSGETRAWAAKYKVNKNDISSLKARQNRARSLQSSGKTIAEIADIMGAPVSSIKDYLYEDFDSLR